MKPAPPVMKTRFPFSATTASLAAGAVLLLAVPSAVGGSYFPPPGDSSPAWSPDGTYVSFVSTRGGRALHDVKPDGTAEQTLITGDYSGESLSPDWRKLTWIDRGGLYVKTLPDGPVAKLASAVDSFVWAPDSTRVAALSHGVLAVVGLNGDLGPPLAQEASDPDWSPDGDRIAVVERPGDNADVHVVRPGGGDVNLTAGDGRANIRPLWSRDGKRIAFVTSDGAHVQVEVSDLAGTRRRVTSVSITNGPLAWLPNGDELAVGRGARIVAVDVSSGRERKLLPFGDGLVWSPDGTRIAFSSGAECRDRSGIYVARTNGTAIRRITNDCRIVGTAGADRLKGTPLADVLVGLGGNDRLIADDPGYVGDTLLGGPGDDVLVGAYREDDLDGGPGNDVLRGGPSGDRLIGGPGADAIDGQGGRDTIYAADGRRDRVVCGTNAPGTPEKDVVYADRLDSVARDCEVVHRR